MHTIIVAYKKGTLGSYDCDCKKGFFGNGFDCIEGKCTDESCSGNQTCVAPTSSSCHCSEGLEKGFRGLEKHDEYCFDVDECDRGIHKCGEKFECFNTLGDYACKTFCEKGFKRSYNGTCLDIDECILNFHNCSSELVCINTNGGFSCKE